MLRLLSPLNAEEGLARLKAASDPQWKLFGSKPVLGDVVGSWFFGCKRIKYGNSFRTFVFVHARPQAEGSHFTVRLGISPFVFAFMIVWWSGLIFIGGAMLVYGLLTLLRGRAPAETWMFVVIPVIMCIGGVALIKFGRWLGRDEAGFLSDFVKTRLLVTN